MKTIEPSVSPLPYALPALVRRRPRAYEEWSALRRWGLLSAGEELVIGYQLREAREEAGLTQSGLAAHLGCTQQAVSQAERWQGNPTIDLVRRWAAAVGADLEISLRRRAARAPRRGAAVLSTGGRPRASSSSHG